MGRRRKKRISPKTIFIACEGSNTEPLYFESIKEEIEEEGHFVVEIYPNPNFKERKGKHYSDPIGLIKEAQSRINDYDEVWAVYDKNGYTKHKEALTLANTIINGKSVKIAFSSIAFEQWILLHFERTANAYSKSQQIINTKFINGYLPDYEKNRLITFTSKQNI